MTAGRRHTRLLVLAGVVAAAAGCGVSQSGAPACEPSGRLGLVAQSVPSAAYLPCVGSLAPGWRVTGSHVERGRTRFTLLSDRAEGRAVKVELLPGCDVSGATPATPRAEGVRTYLELTSISPRYAGVLSDVFPGGCVQYRFAFPRGPHIGLVADLEAGIELYARNQLRLELRDQLGVELDP